jgi:hypothetical protein
MGKMARKLAWTVLGTAASTGVRRVTRKAMHDEDGTPRLPRRVRRKGGLAVGLAWVAGAAAAMAIADVMAEQARQAMSHHA